MWPLVLTSLVVGWAPVVPWFLASSEISLEGLLSFLHLVQSPFGMFSYLFLINRTIFVRETSFQQVLLSSSGPKENIFFRTWWRQENLLKACLSNKNSPVNEKKDKKTYEKTGWEIYISIWDIYLGFMPSWGGPSFCREAHDCYIQFGPYG